MRKPVFVATYHTIAATACAHAFLAPPALSAQPVAATQCTPDPFSKELVPKTPNLLPVDTLPIQAEAHNVVSSPQSSILEGDAHIWRGDQHVRAERVQLDRASEHVRTEQGFLYSDPEHVVRGQSAAVDTKQEKGDFRGATYFLPENQAQGMAERVQVDRHKQHTQLEKATYSTCQRGQEAWQLRADAMTLDSGTERGEASNITLAIQDIPVLYLPYLSFPISDKRQSGFLASRQSYTTTTGLDLRIPYYWNIAPDQDFTLTPRMMSTRGLLLGGEYRYVAPWHSGTFGVEIIPEDQQYGSSRGSLNLAHYANPWPHFSTDIRYEYVSDDDYVRDLSSNLAFLAPHTLERHFEARYDGGHWRALTRVQGYQVLTPSVFAATGKPYDRMPQIVLDADGPMGVEGVQYQWHGELVYFSQQGSHAMTGTRLDMWPSFAWSLQAPWGFLQPEWGMRYTQYQLDGTSLDTEENPSRTVPVLSVDSGLLFERPWDVAWFGPSKGIQTLEPRLFYLYIPYRRQDHLPIFDSSALDRDIDWLFRKNRFTGADRFGDAQQLTAALTTRLLSADSGMEWLQASIGQVHYFQDRKVHLSDIPPDTASNSGIIAQGAAHINQAWSLQAGFQLEPDNTDVLRHAFDLRYHGVANEVLNISYLLDRHRSGVGLEDDINTLDMAFSWPLSGQWRAWGRWNRALNTDRNLEVLTGLTYEDCCWGLRVAAREYRNSALAEDAETAFYVELELKGLSRVGTGLNLDLE